VVDCLEVQPDDRLLELETWKVAPALPVGCTAVLKPASVGLFTAGSEGGGAEGGARRTFARYHPRAAEGPRPGEILDVAIDVPIVPEPLAEEAPAIVLEPGFGTPSNWKKS
jgi:hypothetical protein